MREVNETYVLPNPPSRQEAMISGIRRAVTKLVRAFRLPKYEPEEVSCDDGNFTA